MYKKEYVEFGEEWKKEMKKLNKDQIIEMFKERCQRVQFLECRLRKLRQTPAFSNVSGRWVSVIDKPLFEIDGNNYWTCTKDGEGDFIAYVPTNNGGWIRHCIIKDREGLCVISDDTDYNQKAGYELSDVTHYMKIEKPNDL